MGNQKAIGICPICAFLGDNSPKTLEKSHIIPRAVYRSLYKDPNNKIGNRHIEMPSGRASKLDVTQDQGAQPLLCFHCEQQISKDIEKPAIELYKRQLGSGCIDFSLST